MLEFYTNVICYKNTLLVRGYDHKGKRFNKRVFYKPYAFLEHEDGTYKTLEGKKAFKKRYNTIYDGRKAFREAKDVSGYKLYGLERFEYTYLNDTYPTVEFDRELISVSNIDIEVLSDDGFPHAEIADKPITAITIKNRGIFYVFGCHPYINDSKKVKYFHCKNEKDLIYQFIRVWVMLDADIVTGWNIDGFDIPYLINRITRLFGEEIAKLLSPWKIVDKRTFTGAYGKEQTEYTLCGVALLDYLKMYKKFTNIPGQPKAPNNRLDTIANWELGEHKLDYAEYTNLPQLYRQNFQKFMDYNIHDVNLVDMLDNKLGLINLALAVAYDGKFNFEDVFQAVKPWDIIIHNHLLNTKKIVVSPYVPHGPGLSVPGGYVKDPLPGLHKWIVSMDVTSEYPHNIIQWNISPETYVGRIDSFPSVDEIVRTEKIPFDFTKHNYTIAGNGCMYRKDKQGIFGEIMEKMFDDRAVYKKKMIDAKRQQEKNKNSTAIKNEIAKYDNLQQAKKIQLNSGYGCLANDGFRYYSYDNASAVTQTGQLVVKWAEKKINVYLNDQLETENIDYVIACDTDSMYFTLDKIVEKAFADRKQQATNDEIINYIDTLCKNVLVPYINKGFEELAKLTNAYYTNKITMKREVISDRGFWVAKKRYALNVYDNEGVRYTQPKEKIMGSEAIRSSTPAACRDSIREATIIILRNDEKTLIEYINSFKDKFLNKLSFDDIAFPRGSDEISKYADPTSIYRKATPIHVKGALLYNHFIKEKKLDKKYPLLYNGDKLLFCYLKSPNPIRNKVISVPYVLPEELELEPYLDRQLQFEKSFLEPIKNVARVVGWNTEKRNTITQFMRSKK